MVGEIFAGLGALKSALDIAKELKEIDDVTRRNAAVIELQEKILSAQSAQASLVERVRELEKELTRLETWDTEKQRYQLTDVGDGTFAYALQQSVSGSEPLHYICANCYEQSKKSILHHMQMGGGGHLLTCPSCSSKLVIRHGYHSPSYVASPEDKARLALTPCPICDAGRLKITASEQDDTFGFAGIQRRAMKCDRCGHAESRLYDPNKG
jgi:Zn finger protein HypA/HybF involved in hydrogenase expression